MSPPRRAPTTARAEEARALERARHLPNARSADDVDTLKRSFARFDSMLYSTGVYNGQQYRAGSLSDYWMECSYGAYHVRGDVAGGGHCAATCGIAAASSRAASPTGLTCRFRASTGRAGKAACAFRIASFPPACRRHPTQTCPRATPISLTRTDARHPRAQKIAPPHAPARVANPAPCMAQGRSWPCAHVTGPRPDPWLQVPAGRFLRRLLQPVSQARIG